MSDHLGPYLLGPNDTPENGIYTGDARELAKAIPDESVDLIFTDPVYDRIEDYRWLAETGARVLKAGGNNVCFVSPDKQVEIANILSKGLTWCDFLILRETARRRYNYGRKIVGLYEVAAWASKGKQRLGRYVNNFQFVSNGYIRTDSYHDWEKVTAGLYHWIDRLSGAVILDPFTGGGTVPAVCKMLQRRYLAFEIDPDTAELARERVRNTQPPLPLEMPTQEQLI
jgi:DNA modification methylase